MQTRSNFKPQSHLKEASQARESSEGSFGSKALLESYLRARFYYFRTAVSSAQPGFHKSLLASRSRPASLRAVPSTVNLRLISSDTGFARFAAAVIGQTADFCNIHYLIPDCEPENLAQYFPVPAPRFYVHKINDQNGCHERSVCQKCYHFQKKLLKTAESLPF